MLNPAYKLTIGDKVVDTTSDPQASTVTDLLVSLDMNIPADSFKLVLGQVDGLDPEPDDEAEIELGYADDDELFQVITAKVIAADPGLLNNRIVGHTIADTLLHSFTDETYESHTAGDIIRDLANQADVDIASIEDGISFPAYVVDGRRSFYRHMRDLAGLCGFDVYINSDGELVFKSFSSGETIHLFDYAKHIIELDFQNVRPVAGSVEAFGESPAGGQADEAWAWLSKDFSGSKGVAENAGNAQPVQLLERSVLRTAVSAQTSAQAAFTRIERGAIKGYLTSSGRPRVRLGDAIRIREMPEEAFNNTFQVRSVTHSITKTSGFMTRIGFQSIT
jgi:phage protein D